MTRTTLCALAVAATLAGACGGASDGSSTSSSSPSSPSSVSSTSGSTSSGCPVPAAPANLAVTTSDTRVTLTWSAVSGAAQYEVLIGSSSGSSNELFTNTANTTYQWNGAPTGQHYARVDAKNNCGTSATSNEVPFTVTSSSFGG